MKTFFTADWHFNHENIIKYCNRPFKTVEEMNDKIIKNYNRLVNSGDVVYFLGDAGFHRDGSLRNNLAKMIHGSKILIIGNHDKQGRNAYIDMGFQAVMDYAEIKIGKNIITLSHYPKRNIIEVIRLFKLYYQKMRRKERTLKQVYTRLKKELSFHRRPSKNYHLCGHVHKAWLTRGKNINVGVDVWNFEPVPSSKILKLL